MKAAPGKGRAIERPATFAMARGVPPVGGNDRRKETLQYSKSNAVTRFPSGDDRAAWTRLSAFPVTGRGRLTEELLNRQASIRFRRHGLRNRNWISLIRILGQY
jgi:hypothetical protein